MSEPGKEPKKSGGDVPIIIKKKGGGHGGHHGGAWKVAYADFVTAMMALFIVLWIMSQGNEVKEKVAEYFKNPIGFAQGKGIAIVDGKRDFVDTKLPSEPKPEKSAEEIAQMKETEKKQLEEMAKDIQSQLQQDQEFQQIMNQIQVQVVDEGLLIELLESFQDGFFQVGSSQLNDKALHLLMKIGRELSKLPNKVVVEGHTDSKPYPNNGSGYTNFDLSADRANSARKALFIGGLPEKNILQVRGNADTQLKNPNDPYDVVNRRVSIIVKYKDIK